MQKYQVKIRYPQHINPQDAQVLDHLDALDVESHFDAIQWKQQQVRQLQLDSHDTSFVVIDTETKLELQLFLKTYATANELSFKLISNIQIEKSHKNLFGLLTIKSKENVTFPSVPLSQVRQYLSQFLSGYLLTIQEDFRQSQENSSKKA